MPRLALFLLLAPALALAQRGPAAPAGPPPAPAAAMPPEAAARYHEAARLYVDGQNAPALEAAEAAVALAPGSRRAVALRDLLKQDQQNPQDQPQDQPQDPPPPPGQNGNEPPPPGQNGPPPDDGSPAPSDRAGEPQPGMTRDQAERILDAVGGDERQLLRRFRREPSRVRTNEQDW